MEFSNFIRKPFTVEAVEITVENIEEIANLIGELREKDGAPFIMINRRLVPNVSRAFPGWFVTQLGDNYRCYSPKVFKDQFIAREPVMNFAFEPVEDEFDSAPPKGMPRPVIDDYTGDILSN